MVMVASHTRGEKRDYFKRVDGKQTNKRVDQTAG